MSARPLSPGIAQRAGADRVRCSLIWQVLYWWIGDIALASPLATLRYTVNLFATEAFDEQVCETLRAFAIAYALAVVIGLLVGFWLGFDRLSGDALEPMVVSAVRDPQAHAVSRSCCSPSGSACRPRWRSA